MSASSETPLDNEPIKLFLAVPITRRCVVEPDEGDTPAETQMQQNILDYLLGDVSE